MNSLIKVDRACDLTNAKGMVISAARKKNIAAKLDFKYIPIINSNDIQESPNPALRIRTRKNITFDSGTEIIRREFYIFEKK